MSSERDLPVIRARGLGKTYLLYDKPHHRLLQSLWRGRRRYYPEYAALHDISFELAAGETLGIIGQNGAGKSTLLQLVCGTLQPTAGAVEVRGRLAALLELGTGFNPEFTGRENIRVNAAILGLAPAEVAARLDAIIAFADIGDYIDQPVKTYSSGMYVRLAFSVVIHVSPDILIVDEALAVGDALFQAKCMTRLRRMLDDGLTLLFISHDIAAVKSLCRRCMWLEHGRLRAFGPTAEVTRAYDQDWIRRANDAQGTGEPEAAGAGQEGTGDIRLLACGWGGEGRQARAAYGQELSFRLRLGVRRECTRLVVSYHLKNAQNQHVLGGHTADGSAVYARQWRAGEVLELDFVLPMHLHHGRYALTVVAASIGDIEAYTDAVFHLWADDVATLEIMPRVRFPLSDVVEPPPAVVVRAAPAIVILDDFFPNLLTGFRVAEYNAHLARFPDLEILSALPEMAVEHARYACRYPQYADRVRSYMPDWLAGCRLAYLNFLNNADRFLADLAAQRLPFVMTLYPGGGFGLHEAESDRKLARVLAAPQLQAIIVTQPVTADYLREFAARHALPLPPLHVLPGVVVNPAYFDAPYRARADRAVQANREFNLCFVAERYMPQAANKGYPEFIAALHLLRTQPGLRVHIVGGGYTPEELAFGDLSERICCHGRLETAELQHLYADMDLIVSPGRPGLLHPGNFDGFPTGACVEAALCGVAMLVTDPLGQNPGYADDTDIFLLDHQERDLPLAAQIAERVRQLAADPRRLARVAAAGAELTRRLYHPRVQIEPRQHLLATLLARLAAAADRA
jgi:lipopolysaccharide transport system ATP-binding protein